MAPQPVIFRTNASGLAGARVMAAPGAGLGEMTLNPLQTFSKVPAGGNLIDRQFVRQNLFQVRYRDGKAADDVRKLMEAAADSGVRGAGARRKGNEVEAEAHFRDAMRFALRAKKRAGHDLSPGRRVQISFAAVGFALDSGEVTEARRLIHEELPAVRSAGLAGDWAQVCDVSRWQDAWLIAAIRRPNPDAAALNVLGDRYWKPLFGRCQLLILNLEKAHDLAQETWCRVLRTRTRLKPGGNFSAYLMAIATNLWRDWCRLSRRSGWLAENRLESLDASFTHEDGGQSEPLIDRVPDPKNLSPEEQSLLVLDIDAGLRSLTPQLRDVLLARYVQGESSAEIAGRYGCTEQTISGWIRRALQKMRRQLDDTRRPMPVNT